MTERWVLNASPLILLGKAEQLNWLRRMGRVTIPRAVAQEVEAGPADDPARQWLVSSEGSACVADDPPIRPDLFAWDLGMGETSVIAWATDHPGSEAVLDDAAARRCAAVFGVRFRGTLGFVALAKRRGFVPLCRPVFARMQAAGLFVAPSLIDQTARSVGE